MLELKRAIGLVNNPSDEPEEFQSAAAALSGQLLMRAIKDKSYQALAYVVLIYFEQSQKEPSYIKILSYLEKLLLLPAPPILLEIKDAKAQAQMQKWLSLDVSQQEILNKMAAFLNLQIAKLKSNKSSFAEKNYKHVAEEIVKLEYLIKRMKVGHCTDFTALWLAGQWLSDQPLAKLGVERDDAEWFAKMLVQIALSEDPSKDLFFTEKARDIERFITLIIYFQYEESHLNTVQYNLNKNMEVIVKDRDSKSTEVKKPQLEYRVTGFFTKEELIEIVDAIIITPGRLIYIFSGTHVTGVYQPATSLKNPEYHYYDSNFPGGSHCVKNKETLAALIFHSSDYNNEVSSPITLHIFTFDKPCPGDYPHTSKLLKKIKLTGGKEAVGAYPSGKEFTLLELCIDAGDSESLRYYLAQDAANASNQPLIDSLFKYAVERNAEIDVLKVLLEYKANPNYVSSSGKTPLMIAAKNGYFEVAQLLLENGAKPALCSASGKSALYYAIAENQMKLVELLTAHGADLLTPRHSKSNSVSSNCKTPLALAYASNNALITRYLALAIINQYLGTIPSLKAEAKAAKYLLSFFADQFHKNEKEMKGVDKKQLENAQKLLDKTVLHEVVSLASRYKSKF